MNIEILYEDKNILALNKPAGVLVHHDFDSVKNSKTQVLTDWLLKKYPGSTGSPQVDISKVGEAMVMENGEEISRPGIVHRLDKETSGVILVAKTEEAYLNLKNQFQNREIKKTYCAFVYGKISEERGIINTPIGRHNKDARKRAVGRGLRGEVREAVTTYSLKKSENGISLVEARPETGRTHQIRVHLKSIHHPVIGDFLYASGKPLLLGFKRLALHARKIVFLNLEGKKQEIIAPFPNDFSKALQEFGFSEEKLR